MHEGITPTEVVSAFWRWFWVGVAGAVLLGGVILIGWQANWWFASHDATRQAELTQNGYANQSTLRAQVTSQLAAAGTITTQIAAAGGDTSLITALRAQRADIAGIVCADAAQISGTPLPAGQAQWVAANCTDGTVSPNSPLYQAGQP
jgi:hypothetical protein